MRDLLFGTTLLSGLVLALPANAANTALILWNAADPGGFEAATGTSSADIATSNLDGISVTLSFVNRTTNPNGLTEGNINVDNNTSTVQTLDLIAGANGYLGHNSTFTLSSTILASLGGANLSGSFFADNSDSLNGTSESVTGVDIGNFASGGLTGPHSFSFNGFGIDSVTGPYGLAESLTLTLQPGAQIGVQSISMDAVPEPKTWALMGIGFAVMAFIGFKRSRKDRLATI